jgi:hypothetical protein
MIESITAQAVRRTGVTLATQPAASEHRPSSPAATFEWPLSFPRYRRTSSADFLGTTCRHYKSIDLSCEIKQTRESPARANSSTFMPISDFPA